MRRQTHDGPQFDAAGPVGRYWLANGEGFEVVDASGRPLGVVDEVVAERDETVTKLVVRRDGLRARRALLDPSDLARVLPAERIFVARGVSAAPRRRIPRKPVVRPAAGRALAASAAGARRGSAATVAGARRGSAATVRGAGVAAAAARRSAVAAGHGVRRADARLRPAVRAGSARTRSGASAGAQTARRFARTAALRSRRAASALAASLAAAYARARPKVAAAARSVAFAARGAAQAARDAARRGTAVARTALEDVVRRLRTAREPLPPEPHDADATDEPITRENAAAEAPEQHAPRSRI